ncbi:MAG: hypothetical protein WB729_16095 [Candidatus Sulfotelmatobacter sp.]
MVWTEKLGHEATPEEKLIFEALDDRRWSWRTAQGIADSTGLDMLVVRSILQNHSDLLRLNISQQFGPIYQLIERNDPPEERFIDKALDYLSMGRRRIA